MDSKKKPQETTTTIVGPNTTPTNDLSTTPRSEDTLREILDTGVPRALDDAKVAIGRGDPLAARDSIGAVIGFAENNKESLMDVAALGMFDNAPSVVKVFAARARALLTHDFPGIGLDVFSENAELTKEALLRSAAISGSTTEVMEEVAKYNQNNTDLFMYWVMQQADALAKGQSQGKNFIDWAGAPTQMVRSALGWRNALLDNEQFAPLMGNAGYQQAASKAVSMGFMLGDGDVNHQNDIVLSILGASATLAKGSDVRTHSRYVDAVWKGLSRALQPKVDKEGNLIRGFQDHALLSHEAVMGLVDVTTAAMAEYGGAVPEYVSQVLEDAAQLYSKYVEADMANFSVPGSFEVIAEVAAKEVLSAKGIYTPMSGKADRYRGVVEGRRYASGLLESKLSERGGNYIVEAGAVNNIVGGVSRMIAKDALDPASAPLWDALREAGVSPSEFVSYASDPVAGAESLRGLVDSRGSRIISEEKILDYQAEVRRGVEEAARSRAMRMGTGYEDEKTMMLASVYGFDSSVTAKLDEQAEASEFLRGLFGEIGSYESASLVVAKLLEDDLLFKAATVEMTEEEKKSTMSMLKSIQAQSAFIDETTGKLSKKQAEGYEFFAVTKKRLLLDRKPLLDRLDEIQKGQATAEKMISQGTEVDAAGKPVGMTAAAKKALEAKKEINTRYAEEVIRTALMNHPSEGGSQRFLDRLMLTKHKDMYQSWDIAAAILARDRAREKATTDASKAMAQYFKKEAASVVEELDKDKLPITVDTILDRMAAREVEYNKPRWALLSWVTPEDPRARGLRDVPGVVSNNLYRVGKLLKNLETNIADTNRDLTSKMQNAGIDRDQMKKIQEQMDAFMKNRSLSEVKDAQKELIMSSKALLLKRGTPWDMHLLNRLIMLEKANDASRSRDEVYRLAQEFAIVSDRIEGNKEGTKRVAKVKAESLAIKDDPSLEALLRTKFQIEADAGGSSSAPEEPL